MSDGASTYWLARAEQMRALAAETKGEISKRLTYRIADDYERFARTLEQRPSRFLPIPPVLPAEVRRFAPCRISGAASSETVDLELPDFLKRGPATTDEVGAAP